eukprot:Rmarinus@m.16243
MASFFAQLRVMLYKNYLLKKRFPIATFLEIFLPVILVLLLSSMKAAFSDDEQDAFQQDWLSRLDIYPYGNYWDGLKTWNCEAPIGTPWDPNHEYQYEDMNSCGFAIICPDEQIRSEFLQYYLEANQSYAEYSQATEYNAFLAHDIVTFESERQFKDYVRSSNYDNLPPSRRFATGVQFYSTGPEWSYSIRTNGTNFDINAPDWNFPFPWSDQTDPLEERGEYGVKAAYAASGFTSVQALVDGFILAKARGVPPALHQSISLYAAEFPVPETTSEEFWSNMDDFVSTIFVIFLLNNVSKLIRGIVLEKEKRIREGMLMMGLLPSVFYLSFYLTYAFIFLLMSGFIALGAKGVNLMEFSESSVVFLLFFLFGLSIISFGFFISVFFNKAKSASYLGVMLFFASFFAIYAVDSEDTASGDKQIACLSPTVAFGLGIKTLGRLESHETGALWSNISEEFDNFAMGTALGMLALDSLLFAFLGWYFDQVVPSEFGTVRPFYFIFTPSYWRSVFMLSTSNVSPWSDQSAGLLSGSNTSLHEDNVEPVSSNLSGQEQSGECVTIQGLRKEFETPNGTKVAVNDLSLSMYCGHITALLGHNGAGKTTTISMLSGLLTPSSGTALVCGKNIRTQMHEIRQMMGVCPQHNILFDELTCEEHLRLFAAFKGVPSENVEKEVQAMITELGLTEKAHSQSASLSGGQKRKLSVGIALIGGSKVVYLDEPTSGMDPYSRRFTWNVLQNQREGRVIVLTTHFMDEADLLGDRIAIMGDGRLKCCGSSLFLKNRYGVGYSMTCVKADEKKFSIKSFTSFVKEYVPEAKLLSNVGSEVSFQLPLAASSGFEPMLATMEKDSVNLGIRSYGLSVTTLEEVFLRVARGHEDPHERKTDRKSIAAHASQRLSFSKVMEEERRRSIGSSGAGSGTFSPAGAGESVETLVQNHLQQRQKDLTSGHSLWLRHVLAIIKMRFRYGVRDKKFIVFVLMIPVITVILSLGLLRALLSNDDMSRLRIRTSGLNSNLDTTGRIPIYYPPGTTQELDIDHAVRVNEGSDWVNFDTALSEMNEYLLENYHCCEDTTYGAFIVGPPAPDENTTVQEYLYMYNLTAYHSPAIYMNVMHDAILRSYDNPEYTSIVAYNHPFPKTEKEQKTEQLIGTTNAILLIVIAFSFIPTAYAVFVVKDREVKTKHQQLISGVDLSSYWLGLWICDIVLYLPPCLATMLVILAFNLEDFIKDGAYGATSLLFMLFGPGCISFTYLCSFAFNSHSSAQTILLMVNVFAGIILMFTAFILQLINAEDESLFSHSFMDFLLHLFSLFPPFCLGNALFNLTLREFEWFWHDIEGDQTKSPYDYDVTGRSYLFLGMSAVVYLIVVLGFEKLKSYNLFEKVFPDPKVDIQIGQEDEDVSLERQRVLQGRTENDIVCVKELRKVYRPHGPTPAKIAVRDICFAIPPGEVFGLLGINGAGKTSTLSMLACEVTPTSGSATIGGMDIRKDMEKIRLLMGYCPQFDALYDLLTAREHLRLFAAIKGVPTHKIDGVVEEKLKQMDLTEFADRLAGTYSGGNKRKLQVAIALIGNPIIVFLDEPSTGMDPVARRFMWDVISRVSLSGKCSMILTTHAMEECEALCSRICVMVGGRFRCLGSTQHLKNRFGSGYQVEIKTIHPRVDDLNAIIHKLLGQFPDVIRQNDMISACNLLGNENRAVEIAEHGSGMTLHQLLVKDQFVTVEVFAEWWAQEDYNCAATDFMLGLGQVALLEKHGSHLRFEVSQSSTTLSALFGEIERNKEQRFIQEYNLSQTSLEQIFNMFAAQQEEEQGTVAGMTAVRVPNV